MLQTILVTYPLEPPSLVDELRKSFKTVHFYPGLSGTDYSGKAVELPPDEVLAQAEAIFAFRLPSNLHNVTQVPKSVFASVSRSICVEMIWF